MGYSIKRNNKVAIKEEVTEGTYVAPAAASDFIQVTTDGLAVDPSKEILERDLLGGGIGQMTPRNGMTSVTGSLKVEMKAHGTEGTAPEYGLLLESGLGATRTAATVTASDTDGGAHSDTVIALEDGDAANFNIGDIVVTKRSGAYHTSPIASKSDVAGDNNITLLIADPAGAYVDGIVVTAVTTYYTADTGHKSFSISKYIEDAVLEQATGCKVKSIALENFVTGQLAAFNFGFDGLDTDRSVSAIGYTPTFDAALPPIILEACVYKDGVAVPVSEFSFSVENELAPINSTCAENGKLAMRVTKRTISGSFAPYKQNDSIANWTLFEANTEFSLFITAKVPTAVAGEYEDVVSVYMPNCVVNTIGEEDADGVLKDTLEFSATTGTDDDENDIYISFN